MANPAVDIDFRIATLDAGLGALATLASLGIPNPRPIYLPGVESIDLGNYGVRIMGAPYLTWTWGFLSQTNRDILRTYCPGGSADVYITSITTENIGSVPNAAQDFLSKMIWPPPSSPESPQAGRRLEFSLVFRQLVVQSG